MNEGAPGNPDEYSPAGLRLLRLLDTDEFQPHIATPEAYRAYLGATAFEDWDNCAARTNAAYRGIPLRRALLREGERMIVEHNISERDFDFETADSSHIAYLPPTPYGGRYMLRAAYQAAREIADPEASALLLRLAIFYTHRLTGGNTRGGAIHQSLADRGYDGSPADRRHYAALARGRDGVRAEGLDIDPFVLPRIYGIWYKHHTATVYYSYRGQLPEAMEPYALADMPARRPDISPYLAHWAACIMAEPHSGVALATRQLIRRGDLADHLVHQPDGTLTLDSSRLFSSLTEEDCLQMYEAHEALRYGFIDELIACFEGRPNVFGRWQGAIERISRPHEAVPDQ